MDISTPYKMLTFCYEYDQRFLQFLINACGSDIEKLYHMEDTEVERLAIEFIRKQRGL
jgi:hypothetical protein